MSDNQINKSVRWALCWMCYGIGHLCHFPMYWCGDSFVNRVFVFLFFQPYQKFMSWSAHLQGVYGFKYWPWGEPDLWEKPE